MTARRLSAISDFDTPRWDAASRADRCRSRMACCSQHSAEQASASGGSGQRRRSSGASGGVIARRPCLVRNSGDCCGRSMIGLRPQELHHGLEFRRSIQIAVPLLPGHENTTRHHGPQRGAHHQVRVRYVSESVGFRGPAIGSPNAHSGECHSPRAYAATVTPVVNGIDVYAACSTTAEF